MRLVMYNHEILWVRKHIGTRVVGVIHSSLWIKSSMFESWAEKFSSLGNPCIMWNKVTAVLGECEEGDRKWTSDGDWGQQEDCKQGCEEQRMCEGRLGMMWKIISSCAGFHTGPLPLSHNFPYPEILKLSMVIILAIYMLLNVSMCHQNVRKFCPRLCQKQSERYINSKFSWGACPQTPLVSMHTFHTLLSSCYHPVFLPPPQLKILYEILTVHPKSEHKRWMARVSRCVLYGLCNTWCQYLWEHTGTHVHIPTSV